MTERLPSVGGDVDAWGPVLNGFLGVSHNADGTLKSVVSAVNVRDVAYAGGAKGDGVTDDTAEIQAALTAVHNAGGGTVFLPGPATYLISAPLTIYSSTTIHCDAAVTVKLASGSSCNMLRSQAAYGAGRDSDITIIGGLWDRQNNGPLSTLDSHSIIMRKVDRLTITDVAFTSTAGKLAIHLQGCADFRVDRIDLQNTFSDGVHIEGGCVRGVVSNVSGTAGDDMVAITPKDYAAHLWGDETDVTDILIDGVFGNATSKAIFKILGGNGLNCKRIIARNIFGSSTATSPIYIGDDTASANTQGGLIDGVAIEGVAVSGPTNSEHIKLNATNGKRIRIVGATYECGAATGQPLVGITGSTSSWDAVEVIGVTIVDGCANQGLVAVVGGVNHLIVSDVAGSPVASAVLIRLDPSTATSRASRILLTGVSATWASATGNLVSATNTGHTIGTIELADVYVQTVANLVDLAITTSVLLSSVTTTGGLANVRAGAVVTISDPHSVAGTKTITNAGTARYRTGAKATPTYSASITPALNQGAWQTITVTNGTAFTINAPTFPPGTTDTADLTVEILNSSGGAMGVVTWNAAFIFQVGAFVNPATTKRRCVTFRWNGANWIQISPVGADY